MSVTVAEFTEDFPEFSVGPYTSTTPIIQRALTIAESITDERRWAALYRLGVELYAAHLLSLRKLAYDDAQGGGTSGQESGPMASRSVGPVSVSYDSASTAKSTPDELNLTTYGRRYASYANMVGMGGKFVSHSSRYVIT